MSDFISAIGLVMFLAGLISVVTSTIGLLLFDGFYKRLHAAGVSDSFAPLFIMCGLSMYHNRLDAFLKSIIVVLILMFTNTSSSYLLANIKHRFDIAKKDEISNDNIKNEE